jgi:transcriptional regulator with XRE-family HTH domain
MADYWLFDQKVTGEIIRRARISAGLSIRGLAAESGVSPSQILRIESGEYDIRLSTLLKVAACVGFPAGLALEGGMIANVGVYANAIGKVGIDELICQLPGERRKRAYSRLVVFCASCSTNAARLLQSSNPEKIAATVTFPGPKMSAAFGRFAKEINSLSVADRVALKRELESDPVSFLLRQNLVNGGIALEFLDSGLEYFAYGPNEFRLVE